MNLSQIEESVARLLEQEAAELVDLRYTPEGGRWVLRVYVDKHGGMTLGDCEYFSERVGALLDAMDIIPHSYVLEVSSPGVDRVLKKEKDFSRFAGHRVKVRLKEAVDGQRHFRGVLRGLEEGAVVVEGESGLWRWPLSGIDEARLNPEIRI